MKTLDTDFDIVPATIIQQFYIRKCSIKEQCHNNKFTKEQGHNKRHSYKTTQQIENVIFLLFDPILSISIS